jgi:N-acylneuraminate cytidylyltransferase
VERVVVSTDDSEIAKLAGQSGAQVVTRPPELSTDTASSEEALRHVLEVLSQSEGFEPDLVVFLQCTSPFTTVEDVEGTLEALRRESADSALAVFPTHVFLWTQDATGAAAGVNHDLVGRLPRQARPQTFAEAGSVYVFRTAGFHVARNRFFGKVVLHPVPVEHCLEIDDMADLERAQVAAETMPAFGAVSVPRPLGGLILDFDGVLTDNLVWTDQRGREMVRCNRSDGLGLARLREAGIPVLVVSKEQNPVVTARCKKLNVTCIQGVDDKVAAVRDWARSRGCDLQSLVFVGNDANDVDCLRSVGLGVAVADAWPEAKRAARFVLTRRGGDGAVREICDLLLATMSSR